MGDKPSYVSQHQWFYLTALRRICESQVTFVFIDTVTLAGVGHERDEITGEYRTPHGDQLPGPADEEFANKQWAWIEDQLQSAAASDYVIVAGHYPVYSICEHGPTSTLV